ncbi:MAG: type I-U CRISPR-associated helicase/endonuclease Cas3 [Verrucomicrobiaceae bacterium]|nr:type I-U CRISPR-associated helicase/endonuclease Cas3 [Verrucomicrobiaceae bacterium]
MSALTPIAATDFDKFFRAVWGYEPFPWQSDFAARVCAGETPDYVTVPTGSGKTACLDAAVFALAVQASRPPEQRTTGRRIFFIVNRRIIVDEAFDRAQKHLVPALANPEKYLASRPLQDAQQEEALAILKAVGESLRYLSGSDEPLSCVQLRGGIYRDRAWAKSITQPMIICSTVDQAGSRLLFRGYGVSDEARPIHAALVAQDSLLLIDEAHISQPFLQTLDWVRRYRLHAPQSSEVVALPFTLVRMTATPPKDVPLSAQLGLSEADREHPVLKARLTASKLALLVHAANAKGKKWIDSLADELETQATKLVADHSPRSIAIMVNRVATARAVEALMKKEHPTAKVHLLLGRMRPLDRDQVTGDLQDVLKTGQQPHAGDAPLPLQIVVSTQCLEVGADLDFDALVTECASLDAVRQRFGRLNRGGRDITARAAIVFPEEYTKADPLDPIYGSAIKHTWEWLKAQATKDIVDFGLHSMTAAVTAARSTDEEAFNALLSPRSNAPVLLPAYLDCWAQTNPGPAADPDVAIFLHGPQRDMTDVQVCWRADLPDDDSLWADTVALCPPTALECLPVPLHVVRQWLLEGTDARDLSGDAPATAPEQTRDDKPSALKTSALIWLGLKKGENQSKLLSGVRDLQPGNTLVLRAQEDGWNDLGHVPGATPVTIDQAERGIAAIRRRAIVRIHPAIWPTAGEATEKLKTWAMQSEDAEELCQWKRGEVSETLAAAAKELKASHPELAHRLLHLSATKQRQLDVELYPASDGQVYGRVITVREPYFPDEVANDQASADDGPDDPLLETPMPMGLEEHTAQVTALAASYASLLGLGPFTQAISTAARLHDIGKADRRFQAMLNASDVASAMTLPRLLAKSASIPASPAGRKRLRELAGLPDGFRHEMLSVALASTPEAASLLPADALRKALVIHLIASHHGQARPFAFVVDDEAPPAVELTTSGAHLRLTSEQRISQPAHALDSGLAERFWQLTRHHGWWGLALLEAVLRLADQTASANPTPLPTP